MHILISRLYLGNLTFPVELRLAPPLRTTRLPLGSGRASCQRLVQLIAMNVLHLLDFGELRIVDKRARALRLGAIEVELRPSPDQGQSDDNLRRHGVRHLIKGAL